MFSSVHLHPTSSGAVGSACASKEVISLFVGATRFWVSFLKLQVAGSSAIIKFPQRPFTTKDDSLAKSLVRALQHFTLSFGEYGG